MTACAECHCTQHNVRVVTGSYGWQLQGMLCSICLDCLQCALGWWPPADKLPFNIELF